MVGLNGLGQAHGFGHGRMGANAPWMAQGAAGQQPSRGARVVGKLDQDGDGKLGLNELKDTRFGSRLSVDRFAQLDTNQDGALDAAEIDAGRKSRHAVESAVTMQMRGGASAQIVAGLDRDQSGGLNSEEIAGTRLADLIGTGFGTVDANRNGALDATELSSFLAGALTAPATADAPPAAGAQATTGTTPAAGETAAALSTATAAAAPGADADDAPGTVETGNETDPADQAADAAASPVAPTPAATPSQGTSGVDQMSAITSSFEAALSLLQDGGVQPTAYDAVTSLYAEVQNIIAA